MLITAVLGYDVVVGGAADCRRSSGLVSPLSLSITPRIARLCDLLVLIRVVQQSALVFCILHSHNPYIHSSSTLSTCCCMMLVLLAAVWCSKYVRLSRILLFLFCLFLPAGEIHLMCTTHKTKSEKKWCGRAPPLPFLLLLLSVLCSVSLVLVCAGVSEFRTCSLVPAPSIYWRLYIHTAVHLYSSSFLEL